MVFRTNRRLRRQLLILTQLLLLYLVFLGNEVFVSAPRWAQLLWHVDALDAYDAASLHLELGIYSAFWA